MFKRKNIWNKKIYISENRDVAWDVFMDVLRSINWLNKTSYHKNEKILMKINSSKMHADMLEFIQKQKFIIMISKKNVGKQIYSFVFHKANKDKHTIINISMEIRLNIPNQNDRITARNNFKIYIRDLDALIRDTLDAKGLNSYY